MAPDVGAVRAVRRLGNLFFEVREGVARGDAGRKSKAGRDSKYLDVPVSSAGTGARRRAEDGLMGRAVWLTLPAPMLEEVDAVPGKDIALSPWHCHPPPEPLNVRCVWDSPGLESVSRT
jgi:hypothetical protein